MIDASKGFQKDGNKNRLREQDIHRIVDTFARQVETPSYSRLVPVAEISDAKNDYNLNLPRYIDSSEPEDLQDISAHLRGGIPVSDLDALRSYWDVFPSIRRALFFEHAAPTVTMPPGMPEAYAEVHFEQETAFDEWPAQFAIITAYGTTGQQWTDEENRAADQKLTDELRGQGCWLRRIMGYSPATRHAEPGWAVETTFAAACDLGAKYGQDAIYYVTGDRLEVSFCDARRAPVEVGEFRDRLHAAGVRGADRPGYSQLRVAIANIKAAIFGHPEFHAFTKTVGHRLAMWEATHAPKLNEFGQDGHPKVLIETISEDLLAAFKEAPLVDPYDIYQHLMDYWAETMQDDCYLIAADGWKQAARPRLIVEDKNKKTKSRPDFVLGKKKYQAELIPPALLIARYFAEDQAAIEALETQLARVSQQIEEMTEEHGSEGGLLFEAQNESGKLTRSSVKARLMQAEEGGIDVAESGEIPLLIEFLDLKSEEASVSVKIGSARDALTEKFAEKYGQLTEGEIKILVVNDKWLATVVAAVQGELDRVSQTLTGRIRQLAERYANPLPELTDEVAALAARVDEHLKKMGVIWK